MKIFFWFFFLVFLGVLMGYYRTEMSGFIEFFAQGIARGIEFLGYGGVVFFMALESMIFPVPSELVMPFAGFLAKTGKMHFWIVVFFSVVGSLIGSSLSYFMGYYGGKKLILRWGKYALLEASDLEKTEKWFRSSGGKTVFFGRFIPVVRHLISIPAGIGRMNFGAFCFYTAVGAFFWNTFLAYCGYALGVHWERVRNYSEYVSILAGVLILLVLFFWIQRKQRNNRPADQRNN